MASIPGPVGEQLPRAGIPLRLAQFALLLLVSLGTRIAFFGDTNFHNDELFFFTVGQRMHDGLLPYVDVWDRKGPVLFAVYWLFAAVSGSILAYQIGAMIFAAATAMVIVLLAERVANRSGAVLAACFYLVMLPLFGGGGGQAPVIYNLFMALAALGVFSSLQTLREGRIPARVPLAMFAAGLAIACKQTAVFEGAFLGCVVLWQLGRSGMAAPRLIAAGLPLALCGAAPMLGFAAFYAAVGHFAEFWHAMVTANLVKSYDPGGDAATRIGALATIGSALIVAALLGFFVTPREGGGALPRRFIAGWLLASLTGVAVIPNFIDHYMLPLVLPLAVAAAPALGWRLLGPVYALLAMAFLFMAGPSSKFAKHAESRAAMDGIVATIRSREDASQAAGLCWPGIPLFPGRVLSAQPAAFAHPSPLCRRERHQPPRHGGRDAAQSCLAARGYRHHARALGPVHQPRNPGPARGLSAPLPPVGNPAGGRLLFAVRGPGLGGLPQTGLIGERRNRPGRDAKLIKISTLLIN
jgi:hypothetical protein